MKLYSDPPNHTPSHSSHQSYPPHLFRFGFQTHFEPVRPHSSPTPRAPTASFHPPTHGSYGSPRKPAEACGNQILPGVSLHLRYLCYLMLIHLQFSDFPENPAPGRSRLGTPWFIFSTTECPPKRGKANRLENCTALQYFAPILQPLLQI